MKWKKMRNYRRRLVESSGWLQPGAMRMQLTRLCAILFILHFLPYTPHAQTVSDELQADVRRAAGMHYALTLTDTPNDTPPPPGKHPFYINHYGCPSAYYLERPKYYDDPYHTLSLADSLRKLTVLGRDVLHIVAQLRNEASDRTGELTEAGKQQARDMARMITNRIPEMFRDDSYVDGRSILENHCLLTMGEALLQVSRAHQPMTMSSNASRSSYPWMNPQDKVLEAQRKDSLTMARYNDFAARWAPDDTRLMTSLFNDADYAKTIDAPALSRQLFDLASSTQYSTVNGQQSRLFDLFTPEDIRRHWMRRNAWAYIRYGGCTLNGGHQPYTQRKPLWNLIHMGDSVMTLDHPVIHLRFTHESMMMSLVCLLELDDYGLQTDCIDSLEALGWADYRIAPLGGSIILIHYRTDKDDPDPLIRVLLNGHEARLPIPTDCQPYYHWSDMKRYYLRKLYAYARERNDE